MILSGPAWMVWSTEFELVVRDFRESGSACAADHGSDKRGPEGARLGERLHFCPRLSWICRKAAWMTDAWKRRTDVQR